MILLVSSKNTYASKRIKREALNLNQKIRILSVKDLADVNFDININRYQALHIRNPYLNGSPKYIPNIIGLAKRFKAAGKKIIDANIASGNLGQGKWADYRRLKKFLVQIPMTTKTHGRAFKKFPYIAKWEFGMKSKATFLIKSEKDLKKIPSFIPKKELMQQEYIEADYEYKVFTVGYKALPVVLRFDFNKKFGRVEFFKSKTITITNNNNHKKLVKLAEKSSKVLGRELAKADILQKGNKFYVLEVNRFPGLKWPEKLMKYNIARDFARYLAKK